MDGETLHLKYNGKESEVYYGDTSDGVYVWSNNYEVPAGTDMAAKERQC